MLFMIIIIMTVMILMAVAILQTLAMKALGPMLSAFYTLSPLVLSTTPNTDRPYYYTGSQR